MSLLHSITKHSSNALNKLPNRFTENGMFLKMGAVKRTPRNNSNSEIIETIKSYADKTPEVKEFVSHIGEMDPKYLGLALDTIELSNISLLTNNNINFLTKSNNNKSILSTILEALPKASKENPEALDLAQTVINNSDVRNSKYFLAKLFSFNISDMKELRPQFGAIKDFIPNLAKEILNPPNPISFEKNKNFFDFIQNIVSPESKAENIKRINKISQIIDKNSPREIQHPFYIDEFVKGDPKIINENLDYLPDLLTNAGYEGKTVDVSGFLTKNIHLK